MNTKPVIAMLLFFAVNLSAQFYNTGTSPASTKWRKIKTDEFQIIYPSESNKAAQRLANALTISNLHTASGINSTIKKPIKIVLHNQSVLSNGYVVWAPRRMELIPTPPQDSYAQNWIDQLALHEYRHVSQIEKLNVGFTKGFSFLVGDIGQGVTTGLLPLWFLEGDAVVNETALSSTGRGREPEFHKGLMALEVQSEKRLRYDQIYLGTYKTLAPNHYEFGYQMVAWAQNKYGEEFWPNILKKVGTQSFTFIPFYRGLKKQADLSKVKLYNETFDSLGDKWNREALQIKPHFSQEIPTKYNSKFVSYRYANKMNDGSIIALRTTIDDIDKLVIISERKEKTLKVIGRFNGSQIACSNRYIAWEENRYDPRWEQRSYSIIRVHDLKQNKTAILKRTERHFSPSISPDEKKIAVQKIYPTNKSTLEIYDIESSILIKDYEHPGRDLLTYNGWINDSVVAVVSSGSEGKAIYAVHLKSGKWEKLFGETFHNISSLKANNKTLTFTYTHDGRQNIYSLDIRNQKVSRLTNSLLGADFGSLTTKGELIYSEYSVNGYKLKESLLSKIIATPLESVPKYKHALANKLSQNASFNIQDTNRYTTEFESTKYSKMLNAINVHSWLLPFYVDLDKVSSDVSSIQDNMFLGATLFSQNILSSVTTSFGYYVKDGRHYFRPSISVRAIYPVISFDVNLGGPPKIYTYGSGIDSLPPNLQDGQQYTLRISQPFNLSTAAISSALTPSFKLVHENSYVADSSFHAEQDSKFHYRQLYYYQGRTYIDANLRFYLTSKRSYRDINPRWGISSYYSHIISTSGKRYFGDNTVLLGTIYLPGIFRHQSVSINSGYEKGFGYERLIQPRGYGDFALRYQRATRLSLQYTLPLLYPDLSIGPFAYIKRLHTAVFYDRMDYYVLNRFSNNTIGELHKEIESIGVELGFETNFLRFFMPVTPTIRYSYRKTFAESGISFYVNSSFSF